MSEEEKNDRNIIDDTHVQIGVDVGTLQKDFKTLQDALLPDVDGSGAGEDLSSNGVVILQAKVFSL